MNLTDITQEVVITSRSKGFTEQFNFSEQLMLVVTELAEAEECYRTDGLKKFLYIEATKPEGIASELADALLRICLICGSFNIPLEEAVKLKMAYNKTRPYRHGNKLV